MKQHAKNKRLSKSSRAWIEEHLNDPFVKQAQIDGYRSRAAYKLLEINDKVGAISKGAYVVDLGAAPGGWSQVAAKLVGTTGRVIASDILPMDYLENVDFVQGDFREESALHAIERILEGRAVDVVLSDMAPNTSGFAAVDQPRMMYLCELAVDFAKAHLRTGGVLIMKVFQGEGSAQLRTQMIQDFAKVKSIKPQASRARSKEMYWVAIK